MTDDKSVGYGAKGTEGDPEQSAASSNIVRESVPDALRRAKAALDALDDMTPQQRAETVVGWVLPMKPLDFTAESDEAFKRFSKRASERERWDHYDAAAAMHDVWVEQQAEVRRLRAEYADLEQRSLLAIEEIHRQNLAMQEDLHRARHAIDELENREQYHASR